MSETSVLLGHRIVTGIIAFIVLVSALSMLLPLFLGSPLKLTAVVRFALTLGLCWQLYQGKDWARILSIVLMAVSGVQLVLGGMRLIEYGPAAFLPLGVGAGYLAAALGLGAPRPVRHYFAYVT